MGGKFWLAVVVVFIVFGALQFIAHGVLLSDTYAQTTHLWKEEAVQQKMFFWHLISEFIFAFLFCFIYMKGFEPNKGYIGQGFRYSIYAGLLVYLPISITHYAVLAAPGKMLAMQGIYNLITVLISGLVLGAIYKPAPKMAA
ncbi:MAG: hypothetical protein A2Z27_03055 [candidate division Zixibacteria bacterium RBG_16_50_21]|nr:MAG: hypothetical protein A2Z27_03055 [candidate division Zixibacteria bacterium RBG_16_50_21]